MLKLIVRRLLETLPVLWCLLTLTFLIARWVPGGPFDVEKNVPPEVLEQLNHFYGYDQPLYLQYLQYLKNLLNFNLGPSLRYSCYSVNQLLGKCIPVSFELGFWAMLVTALIGGIIGMVAAAKARTWLDISLMTLCLFGLTLPTFVLGPIVIYIFAIKLHWFQVIGWGHWTDRILPTLTLACMYSGYVARLTRTYCLETFSSNFICSAFAKGLSKSRIYLVHILKNILPPILTYLGPTAAAIMSGSLVIESLFHIPGAGSLFITAVGQRDTPLLLGTVLYFAVLIIFFNLCVDILLLILDPRHRALNN